jgi:hypothetical protein
MCSRKSLSVSILPDVQVELAEQPELAEEADPIIAADLFRGEKAPDRRQRAEQGEQ